MVSTGGDAGGAKKQPLLLVRELTQKIAFLMAVATRARLMHLSNQTSLAKAIGVQASRMTHMHATPSDRDRLNLSAQQALADLFGFKIDWPEWHDPSPERPGKARRDTALAFKVRFNQESPLGLSTSSFTLLSELRLLQDGHTFDFHFTNVEASETVPGGVHLHAYLTFDSALETEELEPDAESSTYVSFKGGTLHLTVAGASIARSAFLGQPLPYVCPDTRVKVTAFGQKEWRLSHESGDLLQGCVRVADPPLLVLNQLQPETTVHLTFSVNRTQLHPDLADDAPVEERRVRSVAFLKRLAQRLNEQLEAQAPDLMSMNSRGTLVLGHYSFVGSSV